MAEATHMEPLKHRTLKATRCGKDHRFHRSYKLVSDWAKVNCTNCLRVKYKDLGFRKEDSNGQN